MPKLEDVLKARGYSEADLTALAPLLADSKFRTTLEASFTELEGERDKFKGEAEGWGEWYQKTAAPTVEQALAREQTARAEAAAATARLKTLQDQGLIKVAGDEADPAKVTPAAAPGTMSAEDLKKLGFMDRTDGEAFAVAQGQAMATYQNVAMEYAELFPGKSLLTYTSADGKDRGLVGLLRDSQAARKPLYDFAAEKFGFGARRAELAAAAATKHDEEVRAEQRTKDIAEFANPSLRPPGTSKFPFIPASKGEGKQPWDHVGDGSAERVNRVLQKVLA